jgi:hypothetical protein
MTAGGATQHQVLRVENDTAASDASGATSEEDPFDP